MHKNNLEYISQHENIDMKTLEERIATGEIVIVKNSQRDIKPLAVGKGTRVKVNANLGASTDIVDVDAEIAKVKAAENAGADAIMDLSNGGELVKIRQAVLANSNVPLGTVPVYEAVVNAANKYQDYLKMTATDILDVLEQQAKQGVDFFTIHSGITKRMVDNYDPNSRLGGVVSRGGALLTRWINENNKENPFYEYFDDICAIAKKYDVALSLGDGMRPGAIHDSLDFFQVDELYVLGELTLRGRKNGCGVIIEGPGHVPIDEVAANMALQKAACHGAPFYILGPLVTDIAMGYDHIAGAIGGAIAAMNGADFLCIVTPSEHIGHPSPNDIKEGVIASKIAGHAVDLIRNPKDKERNYLMSKARRARDWDTMTKLCLHPDTVKERLAGQTPEDKCSMCGEYCSLKVMDTFKK